MKNSDGNPGDAVSAIHRHSNLRLTKGDLWLEGQGGKVRTGLTAAEVLRVLAALDLAVEVTDVSIDHAIDVHYGIGYQIETDWRPARIELALVGQRWADLHPVAFDKRGTGWQANVDDLAPFHYPPEAPGAPVCRVDGARAASDQVSERTSVAC